MRETTEHEHYVAQIHRQVAAQLFTLRLLLAHLMRPTVYIQQAVVRVGGDTFY